jgi:hypothetical protein
MGLPTIAEVRGILEGYCIDSTTVSDTWITSRMTNMILPYVEKITRQSFSGVQTVNEYVSGNGTNILMLSRRNIQTLIQVKYVLGGDNQRVLNLANIELLAEEGILKAKRNAVETWIMPVFPKGQKNMLISYTVGYANADMPVWIKDAISYLTCDIMLTFLEGRSGGGDVGTQGYNKSYGQRGKYSNIRRELHRLSDFALRRYMTAVV